MKFTPGNAQDIGARSEQQDSFGFSDPSDPSILAHAGIAAVVADGMGGMENGSAASLNAVQTFLAAYQSKKSGESIPDALLRSLEQANDAVTRLALETGAKDNVGTTLAAAVLHDRHLYWVSAGDSRVYYYNSADRRIYQLTRDHVYAFDLDQRVRNGHITAHEAATHPERAALTSYLGLERLPLIDRSVNPFPVQDGDLVLICSDGLYRALSEEEMAASVQADSRKTCAALVESALAKGVSSQDNITVVALQCGKAAAGVSKLVKTMAAAAGIALLLGGALLWSRAVPRIEVFEADRTLIGAGQTTNLKWKVDGGAVTIGPDLGQVAQNQGSRTVSPAKKTTYVLTAQNLFGSARRMVNVDVQPAVAPAAQDAPLIAEFRADPPTAQPRQPVHLYWKAGPSVKDVRLNDQPVEPSGSKEISSLESNARFTLVASLGGKSERRSVDVPLSAGQPVIRSFLVTPNNVAFGKAATLKWDVSSAKSVTLTAGDGPGKTVRTAGREQVTPKQTTVYKLTVTGADGQPVIRTAIVTVPAADVKPVRIVTFTADKAVVDPGGSARLSWNVTGDARSIVIVPEIGDVNAKGARDVTPTAKTSYTLKTTDAGGATLTQTVTVNVVASPKIDTFEARRDGANVALFWRVTGYDAATQIVIAPDIGKVEATSPPEGMPVKTPADHYTLTVTGPGERPVTKTTTVPPPAAPMPPQR